jgi:hypothetical protein
MENGKVSLFHDLPAPDLEQAAFRASIWLKSAVGSLVVIAPVVAIGVLRDVNVPVLDDENGWDKDALLQVAVPGFLVWMLSNFVLSRVATWMGFDLLAESSNDNSLKEAIRTNMTNAGIVLALFLTILIAMLQMDEGLDGTFVRNDMWYRMVLMFGIEACIRGLLMGSFFLIYCEPLNEKASKQFAVDNMIYLGEPTTCVVATLVYFVMACLVWVFNKDGKWVGCAMCLVIGYCVMRVFVVLQYLSRWQNPELTHENRAQRKNVLAIAKAVDGSTTMRKESTAG